MQKIQLLYAALFCLLSFGALASSDPIVGTTYYPYDQNDRGGPGNFNCSQYNYVREWYVAPSDTFGDQRIWKGAPCPNNPWGGAPQCSQVQKTCGVKVKVKCASNCKAGAPSVVLMITDVCPKNHPQNRSSGACQGGPHFDISRKAWSLMHNYQDNIKVTYEVVDGSTPLGPVYP